METRETLFPLVNDDGKAFLRQARTLHGMALVGIDVADDDLTTPLVRLVSRIPRSARMRHYGIEALPSSKDWSGTYGPQGHPIPTEDYIHRQTRCYGDAPERCTISLEPYRQLARQGREGMITAINRAGRDLHEMLTAGQYTVQT